jgi:hypothetical protein
MTRDPRSRLDDPTAERTSDPLPDSGGPGVERNRIDEGAVRRRPEGRDETPRRYDQPADEDPVMPTDDPSLGTKI